MADSQHHIIRGQYMQVELRGSEADGWALQRSLAGLCQGRLAAELERLLDRMVPGGEHWRIDRLDIDAGRLSLENLERDLPGAIVQALEKQLRELAPPNGPARAGGPLRQQTASQSTQAALLHFLATGSLPWWFHLPAGQTLEQAVQAAWQAAPAAEAAPFRQRLAALAATAAVRQRLVRQFSADFLGQLLSRLAPDGAAAVQAVAARLGPAALAAVPGQALARQLWQTAFAHAAQGTPATAAALAAQSWQALAPAERQAPALRALVERHWPEALQTASRLPERETGEAVGSTQPQPQTQATAIPSPRHDAPRKPPRYAAKPGTQTRRLQFGRRATGGQAGQRMHRLKSGKPTTVDASAPDDTNATAHPPKRWPSRQAAESFQRGPRLKPRKRAAALRPAPSHRLMAAPARPASSLPARAAPADRPGEPLLERIDLDEGLYADCAGLVLLHPFLPRFFETLGIAAEDRLLDPERALCLLHFLATGQRFAPEYALLVPKLLCNLPFERPAEAHIELTAAEETETATLLKAVVGHWEALRDTSPDGLRGTFLARPGKLSRLADGDYRLQVENQAFDILLESLPWGIGTIKLPWMDKLLWVEWHY